MVKKNNFNKNFINFKNQINCKFKNFFILFFAKQFKDNVCYYNEKDTAMSIL